MAIDTRKFSIGDARGPLTEILGKDLSDHVGPLWHLRNEGEFETVWRELGHGPEVENLWYMTGNLSWCRFYSKRLALRESLFISHVGFIGSYPDHTFGRDQSETGRKVWDEIFAREWCGIGRARVSS